MIASIIRWSVNNRSLVLIATLFLIAFGIYSVKQTPIDAIPDLSDVQVIIKTSYPGQAPQVVQNQVTYPLTTAMLSVPGAETVRGFSFFGDSFIYVIFNDNTDLYWARSRVLEYLDQASSELPSGVKPELGPDATGVGWIYMYSLIDRSGVHDIAELRSLQDWFLKFELQTVPGVSEVASVGGMVKQYQITISPEKLRTYDITLSDIQNAVKKGNQERGASVIEMAGAEYMIRASGYIEGASDLADIPVGVNASGTPLLLQDIAEINIGPEMRRGVTELNGEGEAVGGIVVMRYGENAQHTINLVKEKLESLKAGLPKGVEVIPVYDRSGLIDEAVVNLKHKIIEELVVVALICAVFLFHLRSSFVAIICLPIGILAAFIVMHWQGINANIMSLGGIAIAIGAMIDGAIVMVENFHKNLEKHNQVNGNGSATLLDSQRWKLVVDSAVQVGPALFFSLLIITVSFLPVFALEAQEGRMFSPLAYTKTYAMAAAAALGVTLVPVLMGYFIRGNIRPERSNPINRFLIAMYKPVLNAALRFPGLILAVAVLLMLSLIWPLQRMGSEFMPPLDEGDLMYMPTTFPGISIGQARALLQQTNKLIVTVPEVETVFGKVGRAETATDPAPLSMIETFIQLKPRSEWRSGVTTESLIKELNSLVDLPGLSNAWVMPIKTRIDMLATGIKTPLGIKVSGTDLKQIQIVGEDIENILTKLPNTASVYSERVSGGRYLQIDINRKNAARYGLNVDDIQNVIATAVGGTKITNTVEGLERYSVNIRYPQLYRDSPESLENLPIVTPKGFHIALGDVADIGIQGGPALIKSENARINGWTYIDIKNTDIPSYVEQANKEFEKHLTLPPGYSIDWAGQYEYMERAKTKLSLVIPLTIVIIVVLLYLSFRAWSEVALIMSTLPLALVGSFWLMYILDYKFSVAAGVGLIALAGVAVEIGVIMLVYLNQAVAHAVSSRKEDLALEQQSDRSIDNTIAQVDLNNSDFEAAVRAGCLLRVRPIMMTAGATIAGLLPIMFDSGVGSEVMQRLAAPMVGGMISALILSLLVLPSAYIIWFRRKLCR